MLEQITQLHMKLRENQNTEVQSTSNWTVNETEFPQKPKALLLQILFASAYLKTNQYGSFLFASSLQSTS